MGGKCESEIKCQSQAAMGPSLQRQFKNSDRHSHRVKVLYELCE